MSDVLTALKTDHRNFANVLTVLEGEIQRFRGGGDPDYELVSMIVDYLRNYPSLEHHPKEDLVHERLQDRMPDVASIMGDLEDEHRRLGMLADRFARVVDEVLLDVDTPRDKLTDAATEFIDFYRSHMLMEELRFLPAAQRHLTSDDWQEIDAKIAVPDDPAFGAGAKSHYRRLVDEVERLAASTTA